MNSFYKDFSRESSISDKINNSSLSITSAKSMQKRISTRDNVLFLPHLRSIFDNKTPSHGPKGQRRSVSLSPATNADNRKANEYKIQVSAIAAIGTFYFE